MKNILRAIALSLTLTLGGCLTLDELGSAFRFATASVANPVSANNIYQARNTYTAVLTVADEWRTYCYSAPYKVLMADPVGKPLCSRRRAVLRQILFYGPKAGTALDQAEAFVANHPTLDASLVIRTAIDAVAKFRAVNIPVK